MKLHHFYSTGQAYDACQCDESIRNGDLLIIHSEKVVGVADTWPIAVTVAHGDLHTPVKGRSVAAVMPKKFGPFIREAKALATALGYEVLA